MSVSISESPAALYSLTFLVGACVGSFLNVLAIRSLAEKNLLMPPSSCPECDTRLGPFELIPIVSYFLLGGKCKHCKKKISWQYPAVELFTALWFMIVVWRFGLSPEGLGMLYFSSVLIAVTVTDFREKLIPHEITYPSILLGIMFSGLVRNDLIGTMAGIGGSYILFDFIAFYGLKLYPVLHPEVKEMQQAAEQEEEEEDTGIDNALGVGPEPEDEEFEVMGGGDAVLAALVSAWLGWERLVITIMLGFIFGALLGGFYLAGEMKKAGILGHCIKRGLICFSIFGIIGAALFYSLARISSQSIWEMQWAVAIAIFAIAGGFVGFIWAGKRVSRPFPFGPALALAAGVSMFIVPNSVFPAERM